MIVFSKFALVKCLRCGMKTALSVCQFHCSNLLMSVNSAYNYGNCSNLLTCWKCEINIRSVYLVDFFVVSREL
ncbi:hypothetical protein DRF75_03515 [Ehrlichia minasensis]|uniref:Uncharacterized protein n=1 Tax=Ehrlichia minasensis TaxID=1242993 RepID=A0A4Q6I5V7_9RICK|nr:hypothetical protein DRF75_03515 [Ehrlichia minasensis]